MDYYYSNKDNDNTTTVKKDGKKVALKICGMNKNTAEVAALKPNYLGFIFWEPSKRYFEGEMPSIPHSIKKVGVFVDEKIIVIVEKVNTNELLLVQLHGNENPEYCKKLKNQLPHIKIIKVFAIKDNFDFDQLKQFENVCDYYLFDTKGKLPGGNGYAFNWEVLKDYPSTKPYFLSGGIGLEELSSLQEFLTSPEAIFCEVIDVNSKFEIEPGLKNIKDLKQLKEALSTT